MILIICATRDSAANAFHRPFCVPTVAFAVRSFSDEVNRSGSEMSKHPDDYELFEVGSFDEDSALLTPLMPPRSICRAKDLLGSS